MKTTRYVLIIIAIILIIIQIIGIDFKDLSWHNNRGSYGGILAMVILIGGMIYSNWYEKKRNNER